MSCRNKENKLKCLRDKNKEDKKKYKKALKDKKLSDCRKNDNIEFLEYKIEEMRLNEEQLIEDLYHQQSLAKDAIRSLENLSKQFEVEKSQFKRQAEEQWEIILKKEAKAWNYKLEALKTVNDTLTKRIQRYEEQERILLDHEHKNEQYIEQIQELTQDIDRIRGERKAYKEENHKLMKKIIQIEEGFKEKERLVNHSCLILVF